MPKTYHARFPNATYGWAGCPEDCDQCPYDDCTMPDKLCAKLQQNICHGWVMTPDGVRLENKGRSHES